MAVAQDLLPRSKRLDDKPKIYRDELVHFQRCDPAEVYGQIESFWRNY